MSDAVLYEEKGDGIVVVTLNDPKTRNALTDPLVDGIVEACRRINADTSVRCMILTGAGETGAARVYAVPIDWTPCHYGGQRAWLRC